MTARIPCAANWPAALLMTLGLALSACSGSPEDEASPAATPTPGVEVDDEELGRTLSRLVRPGQPRSNDGQCFVSAVHEAGLNDQALARIVEVGGQDFGSVVADLTTEVDAEQAELLASPGLRSDLDACVDAAVVAGAGAGGKGTKEADYEPIGRSKPTKEPKVTTNPRYEVSQDQPIRSAGSLIEGVVSMFSSYADDEEEKAQYAASGECLSRVIHQAGFSQESLRFIAGGAPLGSGSIADFLPNEKDKKLWGSTRFVTSLDDCIVSPEDAEEKSAANDEG